jgi:polyisoprenoid-binding protein YceI
MAATAANTSTAPSAELVPAGHWTIDGDHSSVNFVVHHLGITRLRGRFSDVSGTFTAESGALSGTATVTAASLHTGSEARDRHVKGPDFLNVEINPLLTFSVDSVQVGAEGFVVQGSLTLNGVTRPVEFAAVPGGTAKDPYGHDRVGLALTATVSRRDFGITFDPSGALVSDVVALEIDLSLVRQPDYLRDVERRHRATAG